MKEQDYEQLTLFQEDSRVNRFPLPDTKEARMMTVTSGRKCLESYRNSTPLGCLVKMCLGSSIWHSTRCLLTWKTQDTPSKRLLFRLAVSTPRTKENDVQSWPTPTTNGLATGRKTLAKMLQKGLISEEEHRQMTNGHSGKTNPQLLEWLMGYEQAFTQLIPTPTKSTYKGAPRQRFIGGVLPEQHSRTSGMHSPWEDWPGEPELDRVVDGVPNRVDRIKCLGNAVVPQQFYPFFKAIADIENGKE